MGLSVCKKVYGIGLQVGEGRAFFPYASGKVTDLVGSYPYRNDGSSLCQIYLEQRFWKQEVR